MPKKKPAEERKPDLNESDNQAELEARIKEMMEIDEPKKPAGKPITITMHEDESPATAPELPVNEPKAPISIKIVDHNESTEDSPESNEDNSEVMDAIAEANAKLKNETEHAAKLEVELSGIKIIEPDVIEPETVENEEKIVKDPEAHDADNKTEDETDDLKTAPKLGGEEAVEPVAEVEEIAEQNKEETKERPLKHLDSIVPKTKTIETIESDRTDKAVEEIISKESDDLLRAEDEKLAAAFAPVPKRSFGSKIKGAFKSKLFRYSLVILLLMSISTAAAFPETRYYALNTVGVRSSASLAVIDESTRQPLRGVSVQLAGQTLQTDQDGKVNFTDLKLGRTNLIVEKRAFAPATRSIVLGWGSNPLADISLTPTGAQYRFKIVDFLSGKPVVKAEATSSEGANALSNENGEIRLTIDQQDDKPREVVITGNGYREEKFELVLDQKDEKIIQLVPGRKHAFISKRSGRFDVYKVDADGLNEKLVLPGTGSEREDMMLIHHPTEDSAALVSTKDNKRNAAGFLLSTLTVMNMTDETTKSVVTSERVQVIDWIGNRLIYVAVKEGASGDSPDRHKLVSYDYKTKESKELAASNYFNDVLVAKDKVYYAPSSTYATTKAGFYMVNADGSDSKTLLNREAWNLFRISYDKLAIAVEQEWYELQLGDTEAAKISGEPPSRVSRIYVDSPNKNKSLWVDSRDGKGVLLVYNSESKNDDIIRTQGGLKQPVRWLSDRAIVYRINTESETADYILSLDGGEAKKIRDVTNTSGINTWYYY